MKLLSCVLLWGGMLWCVFQFMKIESPPPLSNEALIFQFEQMKILTRNSWKKESVIEGVQIYTAHSGDKFFPHQWSMGFNEISVISQFNTDNAALGSFFALNECFNLVDVMTNSNKKQNHTAVTEVLNLAMADKDGDGFYQGKIRIGGQTFSLTVFYVTKMVMSFSCAMKVR